MNFIPTTSIATQALMLFGALLVAGLIARWIGSNRRRKDLLLAKPVSANRVVSAEPFLANRFIGVALSAAVNKVFAKIPDLETKSELFEILTHCANEHSSNPDKTITIVELSRLLQNRSEELKGTPTSKWLRELSYEALSQLETVVDDVSTPKIKQSELNMLFSFCLHGVKLANTYSHA